MTLSSKSFFPTVEGYSKNLILVQHSKTETIKNLAKYLLDLNKRHLKAIPALVIGHGSLRCHLKKMGIDICRFSPKHNETAEYTMYDCVGSLL